MASLEDKIQQLMEMGATRAQAQYAFKRNEDVMEAAQEFFDGKYDNVKDDGAAVGASSSARSSKRTSEEPDEDEDDGSEEELEDDGEVEDFGEYDSDEEFQAVPATGAGSGVDPYAGIFFSKDRREEVIEVEETPDYVPLPGDIKAPLMTQGEWMKGCPEGGEQGLLFQLYSKLSGETLPCPNGCGASIVTDKSLFFAVWPKFSDYVNNLRNSIEYNCATCNTKYCRACGERVDPQKASKPNYDKLLHCPDLQGVILGVGLAMLEHLYASETNTDDPTSKKRKSTPSPDEEDEYAAPAPRGAKKAKGGIGYAGNVKEDMTGQVEALRAQQERDTELGTLMKEIRLFLPSLRRQGGPQTSDYLVHPTALAHLRRRFNLVASSLLRNDSLADMSDRDVVYFELFEWFEIISNHEALASMMGMPIMVVAKTTPLKPQQSNSSSRKGGPAPRERTIVYEGSSGPRELMESIVIQAKAALKGLGPSPAELAKNKPPTEAEKRKAANTPTTDVKGKGKAGYSEENMKLRNFCERILATADAVDRSLKETKGAAFLKRLHDSLPKVFTASSAPGGSSSENLKTAYDHIPVGATEAETRENYLKWAQQIRFEYCDLTVPTTGATEKDTAPNYRHAHNSEIRVLANSDIPKRSLAIAKELATLTTNLPVAWESSVFLRVDETRVDVIKALIIGPDGTPYENGCYLFDIFLGPNYNQSSPSVKYMTTNGGKYRFNPNLYADGKVCLSLLGTWSGPGWIAGKSTLLQVLISIQSMILNEEPYLNEPGWANSVGTPQSKAYSANVRRMVVHTAMLGNIQDPPAPFADIIRTHFRLKAKSLVAQLEKWQASDDGLKIDGANSGGPGSSGSQMKKDIEELKLALKQLTANGDAAKSSSSAMETD
ncbi:hypothetical protein DL93DRAFT_1188221 [Clavulina sp. PMI_390]|nr:hypothetical protein DL93DRAFT_1188221 [Clavulina sp. PMI_390]